MSSGLLLLYKVCKYGRFFYLFHLKTFVQPPETEFVEELVNLISCVSFEPGFINMKSEESMILFGSLLGLH